MERESLLAAWATSANMELDFDLITAILDLMETRVVFKTENFEWIDIVNPKKAELEKIALQYGLHATSVQDCLDPEHLPKFEKIGDINFIILRSFEENPPRKGDSIQELTRKIAVFYNDRFMITVHRKDQKFLLDLIEVWKSQPLDYPQPQLTLLPDLIKSVIASFEKPIDAAFVELEDLEVAAFGISASKTFKIQKAYYFKRKTFVIKLVIRLLNDAITKLYNSINSQNLLNGINPRFQDLKENCESCYFYSDELMETITTLIGLYLSLSQQKTAEAAYKTGEIVRVLTVFSIFLLPLNVITGIYGMNFEHIPGLKDEWGYYIALIVMAALLIVIYFIMNKKGWLKNTENQP